MLILDKPRILEGSSIELPVYHRTHLALFDGTWVSVVSLPAIGGIHGLAELFISPISLESWGDLWRVTMTLTDRAGLLNDIFAVLSRYNVNILTAEASSIERESAHTVEIVCDAHNYETANIDSSSEKRFRGEFEELIDLPRYLLAELLDDIALDESGQPRVRVRRLRSLFRARRQYDASHRAFTEGRFAVEPIHARLRVVKTHTGNFGLEINKEVKANLSRLLGKDCEGCQYLLLSDTKDRFIRAHFSSGRSRLVAPTIRHRERPGAIHAITAALRVNGFNVLTMLSRLTDQTRHAETEFVLTNPDATDRLEDVVYESLRTRELVEDLEVAVAYPSNYKGTPSFDVVSMRHPPIKRVRYPRSKLQPLQQLNDSIDKYERRLAGPGSNETDRRRLEIATTLYKEENRILRNASRNILFISCSFHAKHLVRAIEIARELGFVVDTGEELEGPTKASGVIKKIQGATHFVGIWTSDGGIYLQEESTDGRRVFWPSPWMNWELGVAQACGLRLHLVVSDEVHPDSWQRINKDPPWTKFGGHDFESRLKSALTKLRRETE